MAKEETKKTETVEASAQATAQATAAEMAGVGTLYNKLNTFLINVEKGSQAGTDTVAKATAPAEGK